MRWSDKQVRDLVNAHLKDMDALYTWGTRDNAMAKAGHEFTPSHVDWSQMNGTDDLMSLIDNVMHAKADDYASVRGGYVMSDKSVEKLADDLARIYNVDPAQFLGGLSRAGKEAPLMAARVETGFAVGTKILSDAYELARRRMLGAPDATGPEVGLQIKRMFGIGGEAINHSFSIVSNSARTTRKGFKSFGWSRKTLDAVDQMDPEKLINALYKSGGDPRALAKIVNPTFIERLGQVVGHLMTNNLLWGLKTHVRNNVSNSVMLILRPTEKIVGGSIIRILNRSAHVGEMSTVTKQARKEYAATVASMQDAWDSAIEAFKRGDSKLIPHDPEGYNQVGMTGGQITNRPIKSFEDMLYWAQVATGGSTRIMGASDEFFKQARYKAVVTAKAAVEGEEAGLVGDQLKRFIARRVDESFDETGQALDEAAAMESRITTFTDPLEHKIATGIQAMVAGSNGWGRIIMPFTRTPFKAWGYGVRYTPGLQMLHKRFMRDLKGANGAEAQATAAGQMALGYTATAMIGYFASQGLITGRGPTNKDQKAWLMNQGWSPYSLRLIGEDGKQTFVPLNNFDQIGVALGLVADLVDMGLHPDRQDEAMDVMSAIVTANAQYLTEKSNLVGLSRFFEMLNDPGKKSPSWLGGIGESLIPFSSALRTYANDDPYMREARNIVDHALDRMPGVGKELAPKFDFFGEPRLVNKGMYSEGQWNIEDVEVERLIMETGHMFSEPSFDVEGEDMRDIRLADGRTAYEVYNEALQKAGLRKLVRDIVTTKGYDEKPDGENVNDRGSKLWLIATYTSKLRNAVKKQVIAQHPELRGLKAHRTLSQLEAVRAKKAGEDEHPNILQRALDVFSGNQ